MGERALLHRRRFGGVSVIRTLRLTLEQGDLYATAPGAEDKLESDGNTMSPPEIGGDEQKTTLGQLDGGPLRVDPNLLLDAFLPASDGTMVGPELDCTLNLTELRTTGPKGRVLPESPADPEQYDRLNAITETSIFTGEADVTATGYQCGGREVTNTIAFRVDVTRVRASDAPWKTTFVALGRDGEAPETPVYAALDFGAPELGADE